MVNLDKKWVAKEWGKRGLASQIQMFTLFINIAFTAHQQIRKFINEDAPGMTEEIFELAELALKINALIKHNVDGLN